MVNASPTIYLFQPYIVLLKLLASGRHALCRGVECGCVKSPTVRKSDMVNASPTIYLFQPYIVLLKLLTSGRHALCGGQAKLREEPQRHFNTPHLQRHPHPHTPALSKVG